LKPWRWSDPLMSRIGVLDRTGPPNLRSPILCKIIVFFSGWTVWSCGPGLAGHDRFLCCLIHASVPKRYFSRDRYVLPWFGHRRSPDPCLAGLVQLSCRQSRAGLFLAAAGVPSFLLPHSILPIGDLITAPGDPCSRVTETR
jgi:hypothetical protein